MADKKVPQEPCLLCDDNPCKCGEPVSRNKAMKARERAREVLTDGRTEA